MISRTRRRNPRLRKLLGNSLPAAFLLSVGISATASGAPLALTFGVYSQDKPTTMVNRYRPVLNILENGLMGVYGGPAKIRLQVAATYKGGITNLVEGKVDFAQLGPASYTEAKKLNPGISIIAMEANNGTKAFYGIIAVRANSDIRSLSDLRGKTFAFGNRRSTIGRYLSQLYLVRHDIRSNHLKRYAYLERHDRVGRAVGNGIFDAGALKEDTFASLVERGYPLRELGRFRNLTKPWIARAGLPKDLRLQLREFLIRIKNEKAESELIRNGFVKGSDRDFDEIRAALQANYLFFADSGKSPESAQSLP